LDYILSDKFTDISSIINELEKIFEDRIYKLTNSQNFWISKGISYEQCTYKQAVSYMTKKVEEKFVDYICNQRISKDTIILLKSKLVIWKKGSIDKQLIFDRLIKNFTFDKDELIEKNVIEKIEKVKNVNNNSDSDDDSDDDAKNEEKIKENTILYYEKRVLWMADQIQKNNKSKKDIKYFYNKDEYIDQDSRLFLLFGNDKKYMEQCLQEMHNKHIKDIANTYDNKECTDKTMNEYISQVRNKQNIKINMTKTIDIIQEHRNRIDVNIENIIQQNNDLHYKFTFEVYRFVSDRFEITKNIEDTIPFQNIIHIFCKWMVEQNNSKIYGCFTKDKHDCLAECKILHDRIFEKIFQKLIGIFDIKKFNDEFPFKMIYTNIITKDRIGDIKINTSEISDTNNMEQKIEYKPKNKTEEEEESYSSYLHANNYDEFINSVEQKFNQDQLMKNHDVKISEYSYNGKIQTKKIICNKYGIIQSIENFRDGIFHGYRFLFYENGSIMTKEFYINGKLEGKRYLYYTDEYLSNNIYGE
jgi:hypothetical protein